MAIVIIARLQTQTKNGKGWFLDYHQKRNIDNRAVKTSINRRWEK